MLNNKYMLYQNILVWFLCCLARPYSVRHTGLILNIEFDAFNKSQIAFCFGFLVVGIIYSNIILTIRIRCCMYFCCCTFFCCVPAIESKFMQQKLPAWEPIMTAGTVLPIFFSTGIAFIPLGVVLLITSNNVSTFATAFCAGLRTLRISSLMLQPKPLLLNLWWT